MKREDETFYVWDKENAFLGWEMRRFLNNRGYFLERKDVGNNAPESVTENGIVIKGEFYSARDIGSCKNPGNLWKKVIEPKLKEEVGQKYAHQA